MEIRKTKGFLDRQKFLGLGMTKKVNEAEREREREQFTDKDKSLRLEPGRRTGCQCP